MKWSLRYSLCSLLKNAEQEPNAVWELNWKEENSRSCFLKLSKMKIAHSASRFLQGHAILIIKLT